MLYCCIIHLLLISNIKEELMEAQKKYILNKDSANKKLQRMAYEILENNADETGIILAGIRESGSVIARNIQKLLKTIGDIPTTLITISLDKKKPDTVTLSSNEDFTDKVVIVIDDVANSGRTMFYALQPLLKDHPGQVETLALLERTHKQFPIELNYVGHSISTTKDEMIVVTVSEGEVGGAYFKS